MVSVNSDFWKKFASYQTLKNCVYSLLEVNTVVYVVSLVSNEYPMDTRAAFHEAQFVAKSIINNALLVEHLNPIYFLTSTCMIVNVDDVTDLKKDKRSLPSLDSVVSLTLSTWIRELLKCQRYPFTSTSGYSIILIALRRILSHVSSCWTQLIQQKVVLLGILQQSLRWRPVTLH